MIRADGMAHLTWMQGDGTVPDGAGIWNGHPVTDHRPATVATGCPLTRTRGADGVAVAGAAWVHWTAAPMCSR